MMDFIFLKQLQILSFLEYFSSKIFSLSLKSSQTVYLFQIWSRCSNNLYDPIAMVCT